MKYFTARIFENGRPLEGIRVAGRAMHGLEAMHTDDFYTDEDGFAYLEWIGPNYLDALYIGNTKITGDFYDGSAKTFML